MLKKILNKIYRNIFRKKASKIYKKQVKYPDYTYSDFTDFEKEIISEISPYTMTSKERLKTLINSVEYLVKNNIKGDFVECGVWKGGSSMAIAKTLLANKISNEVVWLFDTFEGMPEPTDIDIDPYGKLAKERMLSEPKETSGVWAYSPFDEVKKNLQSTGYPENNLRFKKGKVEDTLFENDIPEKIALLRLDTDWYESTKIELEVLFPKVVKNGIIIVDDYGHWKGCKKAVDEYITKNKLIVYLHRIDYTSRLLVKNF